MTTTRCIIAQKSAVLVNYHVFLLHANATPYTNLRTRKAVATMARTLLPLPPYSPDLAPSDFHLFGPLEDAFRGCRFANDDELRCSVREELLRA